MLFSGFTVVAVCVIFVAQMCFFCIPSERWHSQLSNGIKVIRVGLVVN